MKKPAIIVLVLLVVSVIITAILLISPVHNYVKVIQVSRETKQKEVSLKEKIKTVQEDKSLIYNEFSVENLSLEDSLLIQKHLQEVISNINNLGEIEQFYGYNHTEDVQETDVRPITSVEDIGAHTAYILKIRCDETTNTKSPVEALVQISDLLKHIHVVEIKDNQLKISFSFQINELLRGEAL